MALTVNADDFGFSESVNTAIAEAFAKKLIDRTTLMANMPCARKAMELARKEGFSDKVWIHVNLTSGHPLVEELSKDAVMCDPAGEFSADFARNMKTRFHLPKETSSLVEKEIRAQFDMYRELGGTLWHVDSHHYVHTDPSIWKILKKVIEDYPVTSVRLTRNMFTGGSRLMHIYKSMLNRSIRRFCAGNPVYFGSAEDYASYFADPAAASAKYDIEVMVHPVYDESGTLCDIYHEKYHKLTQLH